MNNISRSYANICQSCHTAVFRKPYKYWFNEYINMEQQYNANQAEKKWMEYS